MMRVLFCSSLLYLLDSQYTMPAQTDYSNHYNRSPSVSSSVGSHSGAIEDNTSLSDTELSQSDFARKCEERIRLRYMTPQEEAANKDPRLPRPEDPEELMAAHTKILSSLRTQINKLSQDEIFEQTLFRGPKVGLEEPIVSTDIDGIMRSMMGPSSSSIANDPYKHAIRDSQIPVWDSNMNLNGAGNEFGYYNESGTGNTRLDGMQGLDIDMTNGLNGGTEKERGKGKGKEKKVEDGPWNTNETRNEFGAGMDRISTPRSAGRLLKGKSILRR